MSANSEWEQLVHKNAPYLNVPIFQYDSIFRTKEIISKDRARFANAWFDYFGDWGDRGGPTPEVFRLTMLGLE